MNHDETVKKIHLLQQTATELASSEVPIVRQRAEAILGLLRDLMVTVVGAD